MLEALSTRPVYEAEYALEGWSVLSLLNSDDVNFFLKKSRSAKARSVYGAYAFS